MTTKEMVVFQDKKIRRIWFDDEWFYSVVDVIYVLTESTDARNYWKVLKFRLNNEGSEVVTKCNQLKMQSSDGKYYETDCANVESLFRLIQSIPSPKAEPFKLWLARVGYERIQEIQNPELAQGRAKKYYKMQGFSEEWIDSRLRGILVRQELTDEWKKRGIKEEVQFAILTNELCEAIFGMSVAEYRKLKGLKEKNQNLRDNMSDWEVLFNTLGEKAAAEITKVKDAKDFEENKKAAQRGGKIAFNARKELEHETGKSIVSKDNVLNLK